jgi:hypothetical protein
MKKSKLKPFPRDEIQTYSLRSRKSKISIKEFSKPFLPKEEFNQFIQSLPDILAGKDFKEFLTLMHRARRKRKAIIFALGGHVIKVGLNPLLIRLMEEGWISGFALNGAGVIHDFEIAYSGNTSEDVADQISRGRFGMARETGELLNRAINSIKGQNVGLGAAVGEMIDSSDFPFKDFSILGAAHRLDIPTTVHVAIGTDTIHFFPLADGEALGSASLRDFFLFCSLLRNLDGGGVFLNVGSAVILPEVFLKGISYVRNRGVPLEDFSTAVFDFIHHYRAYQNVVKRPLGKKGKGFYFIGHHEIMIPLLAASLQSSFGQK